MSNGKLKFGLCTKCLENMEDGFCKHKDSERALESVWTAVELEFAVQCGYKILKIYEFFLYEEMKPIFKNFYTKLARIKLESEGLPKNLTDEDKEKYVKDLNDKMDGLGLKLENISKNTGRRSFAKDMSNIGVYVCLEPAWLN